MLSKECFQGKNGIGSLSDLLTPLETWAESNLQSCFQVWKVLICDLNIQKRGQES